MQILLRKETDGPVPEFTMVELQGVVTSTLNKELKGQKLGELVQQEDPKTARLMIGTQILKGKVIQLAKPLVLLDKTAVQAKDQDGDVDMERCEDGASGEYIWKIKAIIRSKILFNSRPIPITQYTASK
jgi:chromosome transmission fidelity protein 8